MLYPVGDRRPSISEDVFIAETACVVGDVSIGERSSVWYNSVIRGDRRKVRIGRGCNIQDNAVIHADETDIEIGDDVTVGHGSIVHGSLIKNNVLIGINSIILHGAEIGEYSIIGAGALVLPGQKIPANSVVLDIPSRHIRTLTENDLRLMEDTLKYYEGLIERYLRGK
ncbi:MAG: gamma carbonic anhydrase family protein [Candidatus Methanoperedens sp.]|nr:gamma carbonic anhydrase family protein [Candidatus Methanoperedens nitroreducens]MDJ1421287.1 gamma carbonic anhydrase family protein [Candidatus Methanoperedens sp.]